MHVSPLFHQDKNENIYISDIIIHYKEVFLSTYAPVYISFIYFMYIYFYSLFRASYGKDIVSDHRTSENMKYVFFFFDNTMQKTF